MKNKLLKLFLTSSFMFFLLVLPFTAFAQVQAFDLEGFLIRIGQWVYWIVLTIGFIFIVLAGYTFITADGDPAKVNKAKHQIAYALIGITIVFLAWALIDWIKRFVEL